MAGNVTKRNPYTFTSPVTAQGGLITGSLTGATSLTNIFAGSTTMAAASTTTGSTFVGTFTVAGVPAGAKVWLTPVGMSGCTVLTGACVTSASTVTACIMTVASTSGSPVSAAKTVTFQYLIIS